MRISIVLPRMTATPSGGLKVGYQNAEALAERGHKVTVVHPLFEYRMIGVRGTSAYLGALRRQRREGHAILRWFDLEPSVQLTLLPFLAPWTLPAADVTLLSAWQTAATAVGPGQRGGRLAQLVYDYEFWMNNSDEFRRRMAAALGRPEVTLFSPSVAVTRMLDEIGRIPAASTPPCIDHAAFGCDVSPADRSAVVGFALRADPSKSTDVMLAAALQIHDRWPDVQLAAYGDPHRWDVPPFVDARGPLSDRQLRDFYNGCAVYVTPSRYEGFGLASVEAMACGAALVTTDNGGSSSFATDGINALVVPPDDADALAGAVGQALWRPELRAELVAGGLATAAQYSRSRSTDALETALLEMVG